MGHCPCEARNNTWAGTATSLLLRRSLQRLRHTRLAQERAERALSCRRYATIANAAVAAPQAQTAPKPPSPSPSPPAISTTPPPRRQRSRSDISAKLPQVKLRR
jgi:hypothetical protein